MRVVLTTRLGKKEIGGWGAEGAQTCACAPSADQLGSTSTEEEAHDCHLPSFLDSPLVGLREANIYVSIYEGCVKVCVFIASLVITLAYATASSSVILTGQWSLPIWLAWMWALVMRGAIAAEASQ